MNTQAKPVISASSKLEHPPILVVDDEDVARNCFVAILRRLGYAPEGATNGWEALEKFDQQRHRLVLTDHRMPGMSGSELADHIKKQSSSTPVLMCSGHLPEGPLSVDGILEKPCSLADLRTMVGRLLGRSAAS